VFCLWFEGILTNLTLLARVFWIWSLGEKKLFIWEKRGKSWCPSYPPLPSMQMFPHPVNSAPLVLLAHKVNQVLVIDSNQHLLICVLHCVLMVSIYIKYIYIYVYIININKNWLYIRKVLSNMQCSPLPQNLKIHYCHSN